MRRIVAAAVTVFTLGVVSPAYADHGYYDRDSRECRGGGCGNEREEDYSNGGCKYVCPQDSPITDSFNICLPQSTCHFDGREGEQGGGSSGDAQ